MNDKHVLIHQKFPYIRPIMLVLLVLALRAAAIATPATATTETVSHSIATATTVEHHHQIPEASMQALPPTQQTSGMPFGVFLGIVATIGSIVGVYIYLFKRRGCRNAAVWFLTKSRTEEACDTYDQQPRYRAKR